jgi:hypothetical protein
MRIGTGQISQAHAALSQTHVWSFGLYQEAGNSVALFCRNLRDTGFLPICLPPRPLSAFELKLSCIRDPNSMLVLYHFPSHLTCPSLCSRRAPGGRYSAGPGGQACAVARQTEVPLRLSAHENLRRRSVLQQSARVPRLLMLAKWILPLAA